MIKIGVFLFLLCVSYTKGLICHESFRLLPSGDTLPALPATIKTCEEKQVCTEYYGTFKTNEGIEYTARYTGCTYACFCWSLEECNEPVNLEAVRNVTFNPDLETCTSVTCCNTDLCNKFNSASSPFSCAGLSLPLTFSLMVFLFH